jgi:membrane associated rhomboid family serine protease
LVTASIVALNIAVYVYGLAVGSAQVQRDLGLFGPFVAAGEWYRLVTSGFVHANLLHIGMNMLVIWIVGAQLEPALGRVRFTLLFAASLLAGSAGALLASPDVLTIGASGAAFGLMGALAIGMRQRGIDIWRTGIGTLILINLVFTFAVPGISIGAHIGGLAGGLAAGWVLMQPRRAGRRPPLVDLLAPVTVMVLALAVAAFAVRA